MAKLLDLINYQLENVENLATLLESEKLAIVERSSKKIEALAKDKLTLINQLNQTDQRIASHQDIHLLKEDEGFKQKVDSIRSMIHDCQQANEVNGEALQRAQMSYRKLDNLMQQSRGKIGMTYTAGGQTSSVSTLGTNIKA